MTSPQICLITSVGFRPAAIATTITTWAARPLPPLTHVALLHTNQTRDNARRLESFAIDRQVEPILVSLEAVGGFKDAATVVAELSAPGRTLVYEVSPGMAWIAASYTRALPESSPLLFTHDAGIAIFDPSNKDHPWVAGPLEDLGWDTLLSLHGLQGSWRAGQSARGSALLNDAINSVRATPLATIYNSVEIDGLAFTLDMAYERYGQLYALVVVAENNANQNMAKVRAMSSAIAKGLQLKVSVLTTSGPVAERVRAQGMSAIKARRPHRGVVLDRTNGRKLLTWLNREPQLRSRPLAPGHLAPPFIPHILGTPVHPGGGQLDSAPTLHLHVGENTSTTLNSLFTHKPGRAHLYYDARTWDVVKRTRWLVENVHSMPVGAIVLHRTDLLGTNLPELLNASIGVEPGLHMADISPGTNSQTAMLSRDRRLQLWSQDNRAAIARPLGTHESETIPLNGPPITVIASVQGGPLRDAGASCENNQVELHFYRLLARYVLGCKAANGLQGIDPSGLPALAEARVTGHCLEQTGNGTWVVTVGEEQAFLRLSNWFASGGHWLDMLVGHTLAEIGADEVRIGLRWAWQDSRGGKDERRWAETNNRPIFRDDIDVIARFGHRYLAVECKTGVHERWPVVARTTVARAKSCLGRFALSMVVGFNPRWNPTTGPRGCMPMDIATILDADATKGKLQQAFNNLSSTRAP